MFTPELVRNADVRVIATRNSKNHPVAKIIVNGEFDHAFGPESRISRQLDVMDEASLAARLSGGTFFFVDRNLVDFRDGHYNGFVHEDESIKQLVRVLGIQDAKKVSTRLQDNLATHKYTLGKSWSKNSIEVPEYDDGGDFTSELLFSWNPFVKTVNSAFMLWRLICTNGMRGMTQFCNTKIPLINRWEENLEIANRQIQNKVNGMVARRLSGMGKQAATVAELQLIASHARKRYEQTMQGEDSHESLRNIAQMADPALHLTNLYRENVFTDKRVAAQVPGHLSLFDAYNMATEIRSHTRAVEASSARALDQFANDLVFNRKDPTEHASKYVKPREPSFENHDVAFFGKIK